MKACVNHRHPCLVKSDRFCNEHDTDVKSADREMSRAWAGHPCKYLICPSPGETSKATSKLAPFSKGVTQGKRALQIESSSGCAKAKVLTNSQNWGARDWPKSLWGELFWAHRGSPKMPWSWKNVDLDDFTGFHNPTVSTYHMMGAMHFNELIKGKE